MPPNFMKNYSYHRIKSIFKEDYNLSLQCIWTYKCNRHGKPVRYSLVKENGEIELANVTLDALRIYLTAEGYPLKEEDGKVTGN